MPDWIETLVTLLTGSGLTILTAWMADTRLNAREREARQEEKRHQLASKRSDFQRETLLALQSVSLGLLRNTGASFHQDRLAFAASGVWGRQQLPEDLSNDQLRLITDLMLLASRIRDNELRELTEELKRECSSFLLVKTESEALEHINRITQTQQKLLAQTGQSIRAIDEAEI